MLRSIATVSLGGTLMEKLNAIAAAGFDGVEIFENDLLYFDGSPRDVKRIAADLGLRILLFQPFRDFEAAPRARMTKNFDRAELKFDVMEQLGADLMLVCSNTAPDAIDDDAVAAEDLRALGERAARRGLRIGYEALAWGRNVNTFGRAWKLVQGGGPSRRRPRGRQLPYVRDRGRRRADRADPGRAHLLRATRRRAADAARSAVMEPAFPLLPGPGRVPGDALHEEPARERLRRADLAGDLQRRIPLRAAAPDRDRRDALAAAAGGRARRRPSRPRACAPPPRRRSATASSSSSSRSMPRRGRA